MGTITDSFANLNEHLVAEQKKLKKPGAAADLLLKKWLEPLLPSGLRCVTGTITDIKDRQIGPLDVIAVTENFPPFSEGLASTTLADGVVFCLQVRDWAENDLSQFGEMALQIKASNAKRRIAHPLLRGQL